MPYIRLGCFREKYDPALIPSLEKAEDPLLDGVSYERSNAIYKCYQAALKRNHRVFALFAYGDCHSGPEAHLNYDKYGKSGSCPANGKGDRTASDVYKIVYKPYYRYGCWVDVCCGSHRAIPDLEGTDPILDGDYKTREDAVNKCYQVAEKRGFQVFAVQNGGQCFSGPRAHLTFKRYT